MTMGPQSERNTGSYLEPLLMIQNRLEALNKAVFDSAIFRFSSLIDPDNEDGKNIRREMASIHADFTEFLQRSGDDLKARVPNNTSPVKSSEASDSSPIASDEAPAGSGLALLASLEARLSWCKDTLDNARDAQLLEQLPDALDECDSLIDSFLKSWPDAMVCVDIAPGPQPVTEDDMHVSYLECLDYTMDDGNAFAEIDRALPFHAGIVYYLIHEKLESLAELVASWTAHCGNDSPDDILYAMQTFLDGLPTAREYVKLIGNGFTNLYIHSEDLTEWLTAEQGAEALRRFDPCLAGALLDCWSKMNIIDEKLSEASSVALHALNNDEQEVEFEPFETDEQEDEEEPTETDAQEVEYEPSETKHEHADDDYYDEMMTRFLDDSMVEFFDEIFDDWNKETNEADAPPDYASLRAANFSKLLLQIADELSSILEQYSCV